MLTLHKAWQVTLEIPISVIFSFLLLKPSKLLLRHPSSKLRIIDVRGDTEKTYVNSVQERNTLTKQSWKNKRRREAPIRVSLAIAECTAYFTVGKRSGQDLE